jgi:hypothetical protein
MQAQFIQVGASLSVVKDAGTWQNILNKMAGEIQ